MASKIIDWLNEGLSPSAEPTPEEPARKAYDMKLVAWLDILGIRAIIKDEKNHDAESVISIMSELAIYVKSACDPYASTKQLNYLQIADGFMIVADIDLANELCAILAEIQWKILINLKMLSRGAITAGSVSVAHEGSLIIGPAYVDAYVLESENAIFPRVIMPNAFFDATSNIFHFDHTRVDADHVKYIDYISYTIENNSIDSKRMSNMLIQQGVIEMIQQQCQSAIAKQRFGLLQKYGWMKELLQKNNISGL